MPINYENKNIQLYILLLVVALCVGCSGKPQMNNVADENRRAKNREIAAKNEVTEITRLFQKLEQHGRGMEIFRQANDAANDRECGVAMEDAQKQTTDLEARIKNLPENYHARFTPIVSDVTACASCSDKAMDSCKKARAAINQAIKELYP
jgi:hypothetical protein